MCYQATTPKSAFSRFENPQIWKYGSGCCSLMHCRSLLLPRFLSSTTIDVSVAARPSTWQHQLSCSFRSSWDLLEQQLVKNELEKNLNFWERDCLMKRGCIPKIDYLFLFWKEFNFTCSSDEIHQRLLCIDRNLFIWPMKNLSLNQILSCIILLEMLNISFPNQNGSPVLWKRDKRPPATTPGKGD